MLVRAAIRSKLRLLHASECKCKQQCCGKHFLHLIHNQRSHHPHMPFPAEHIAPEGVCALAACNKFSSCIFTCACLKVKAELWNEYPVRNVLAHKRYAHCVPLVSLNCGRLKLPNPCVDGEFPHNTRRLCLRAIFRPVRIAGSIPIASSHLPSASTCIPLPPPVAAIWRHLLRGIFLPACATIPPASTCLGACSCLPVLLRSSPLLRAIAACGAPVQKQHGCKQCNDKYFHFYTRAL